MKKFGLVYVWALLFTMTANPVLACSWAVYTNGEASIVARTVDWYHTDNAAFYGHGRNMKVKAADSPNGLEYVSKYASIQVHSFGVTVGDAVNEKGLHGAMLYLDGSLLPPAKKGRKDVDPYFFIPYVVSNFATVREVIASLEKINFLPKPNLLKDSSGKQLATRPENLPFHYAVADLTGDRAVIEFVDGKLMVYHGRDNDILSNEPEYKVYKTLEEFGYTPGGTISTIDRGMRAKLYLKDMYERNVTTNDRALMAMRGLLATVFAGTEEIDRVENEVYPTQWWTLVDQNAGRYYVNRIESWNTEVYDFTLFDPSKPQAVELKPLPSPYPDMKTEGSAGR